MANGNILPKIGDFLSAFAQGRQGSDVRQERLTRGLQGQIQALPQGGRLGSAELAQLAVVNPQAATAISNPLAALDQRRQEALFTDALRVDKLLEEGFTPQARTLLENRLQEIQKLGGDPSDTQEILDSLNSGGAAAARKAIRPTIIAGQVQGVLPAPGGGKSLGLSKDQTQHIIQNPDGTITLQPTGIEVPRGTGESEVKATEILDDGTTVQIMKNGTVNVTDPEGNLIPRGPDRAKIIAQAQRFGAEVQGDRALAREQVKVSQDLGREAFKQLSGIRKSVRTIDDIIKTLDRGAETGLIASRLPSVRAASIELDNLRNQMGLDVIGGTTFGALSESELSFALETALPDTLDPVELKSFLVRKRDAQNKTLKALQAQAKFFSGGGTIQDLLEKQEKAADFRPQPATTEAAAGTVLRFDAQGNPIQ